MSPVVGSYAGLAARAMGWGYSSAAPASFELISTTVLASSAASVTFTLTAGQQAAYKHLQLRYTVRSSNANGWSDIALNFNSDTSANYTRHNLRGTGASVTAATMTAQTYAHFEGAGNSAGANVFGIGIVDFLDAFSTTKTKTSRALWGRADSADYGVCLESGEWLSTAAINSITLGNLSTYTFAVGSRFTLLGVRG